MAGKTEEISNDFYRVLGLHKGCTQFELKNAYKKLALKWHPDRFSSLSGNSKLMEDAKKKFQAIQEAYSVLSDETKRLLYDVGVYDNDDDQNNHGMGEFLNEIASMMCESKPSENIEESFEQLQNLFKEVFQGDSDEVFQVDKDEAFASTSQGTTPSSSTSFGSAETLCTNNKRSCSNMNNVEASSPFNSHFQSFSIGVESQGEGKGTSRGAEEGASSGRQGRKRKVSSSYDVTASYYYTRIST